MVEPANSDTSLEVQRALIEQWITRGTQVATTIPDTLHPMPFFRLIVAGAGARWALDNERPITGDQLAALSTKLNATYIGYGSGGKGKAANQVMQDENAAHMGSSVAAGRAAAKASAMYDNAQWDLVDRHASGGAAAVAAVPREALPPPLAALAPEEREKVVVAKSKEREQLKKEIADLAKKRDEYIRADRERKPAKGKSFDDAMLNAFQ